MSNFYGFVGVSVQLEGVLADAEAVLARVGQAPGERVRVDAMGVATVQPPYLVTIYADSDKVTVKTFSDVRTMLKAQVQGTKPTSNLAPGTEIIAVMRDGTQRSKLRG
jgi:hypothetical protein